jgi:hypothetical protein
MPESPDFEEWARQVHAAIVLMQRDPDLADMSERVARTGIEELLKRIWNARGAADIAKLETELSILMGATMAGPYVKNLDRALRTLDR